MIGIYKIENKINGKIYIGQSIAIKTRWQRHKKEARLGREQTPLYLALRKYGIENFSFEVIEECSQELLDEKENYWITYYKSNDRKFGYNIFMGGQGKRAIYPNEWFYELWDSGLTVGEIQKKLKVSPTTIRAKLSDYKNYNTHNSRVRGATKAVREKKIFFPVRPSYEIYQYDLLGNYIQSFPSVSSATKKYSDKGNDNILHAINGKQKSAYGFQWSKEKVERMKPVPTHLGKLVECIETGQLFPSTVEAAKWAGLKSKSGVRECCAGIVKSAGKHPETGEKLHWRYYEEV